MAFKVSCQEKNRINCRINKNIKTISRIIRLFHTVYKMCYDIKKQKGR